MLIFSKRTMVNFGSNTWGISFYFISRPHGYKYDQYKCEKQFRT